MIALLFPGQGSQAVGMLRELAAQFPVVQESFYVVSEACGMDLWQLASDGPAERLDRTIVTQPAMLAAGVATWRVWETLGGPKPAFVAGHSLGEYCALVAAGVLELEEAARLVNVRARAMQRAVPVGTGAMAALLKLEDAQVEAICREVSGVVEPANYNAPGQVVVAGEAAAVDAAMAAAKAAGGRALPLKVSVPSHCSLMREAAASLAEALASSKMRSPTIPILHNVDVRSHDEIGAIRSALTAQMFQPVQWTRTATTLADRGVRRVAECGPGKVLSGLLRRAGRELDVRAIAQPEALRETIESWRQEP